MEKLEVIMTDEDSIEITVSADGGLTDHFVFTRDNPKSEVPATLILALSQWLVYQEVAK